MKWLAIVIGATLALSSCNYKEVTREIGYKGKARINPWLAAERFCEPYPGEVLSLPSWRAPDSDDAVWFVPGPILNNLSFGRQLKEWIGNGGHLVILLEHADPQTNDWSYRSPEPVPDAALISMLEWAGIDLKPSDGNKENVEGKEVELEGVRYEVDAKSRVGVSTDGGTPGVFASVETGDGRMTVLTDARIFRNRWIDQKAHAALLDALIGISTYDGNIGFVRGSGISLWNLVMNHLWPLLAALGLLLVLWLWKSFSRFGPLEAAEATPRLRGYDHHLEALGDFQWRLDRAVTLLVPLRSRIVERGQHLRQIAGRRDDDFFQFLSERCGIPRERVARALSEFSPADTAVLTRTTADLQQMLSSLA